MKNILIRGKPGSGKTTLIIKILDLLKNKNMGGFYTQEIRERGKRTGFKAKILKGGEGTLAWVNFQSGPEVGKYRVDTGVIDELIAASVEEAVRYKDVVIIDEIGKMEMFSEKFKSTIIMALDSEKKVLATIPVYSNRFLDSITSRSDIEIFDLNVDNRDRLVEIILDKL